MQRRIVANLGALGIAAGAWTLRQFSPSAYRFYPHCLFFEYTHLECPGCGGTRALAALLHGDVNQALHWNAMTVVLLPLVLIFLGVSYERALRSGEFRWPQVPLSWLKVIMAAVLIFTIARNLHSGIL